MSILSPNAEWAFNRLMELGWSRIAAAGIVGNLMRESTVAVNPAQQELGRLGIGFGIAQWTYGARRQLLKSFAAMHDLPIDSLELQVAFIDWELNNTESEAGDMLRAATNVTDATNAAIHYESPDGYVKRERNFTAADGYEERQGFAQLVLDNVIEYPVADNQFSKRHSDINATRGFDQDIEIIQPDDNAPPPVLPSSFLDPRPFGTGRPLIEGVAPGWTYVDDGGEHKGFVPPDGVEGPLPPQMSWEASPGERGSYADVQVVVANPYESSTANSLLWGPLVDIGIVPDELRRFNLPCLGECARGGFSKGPSCRRSLSISRASAPP